MSRKRQLLVETAIRLFGERGFHNTGIDLIAREADVSKKTMYHHFRSKEELILAALKHHDSLFRNFFMKAVTGTATSAYERLLGIFDVAEAWFAEQTFYGCMFINAIGEYAEREESIRGACQAFKTEMRRFIAELSAEADVRDPEGLADALALLLEGAIVTAQVAGKPDSAQTAKAVAKVLVDRALADTNPLAGSTDGTAGRGAADTNG